MCFLAASFELVWFGLVVFQVSFHDACLLYYNHFPLVFLAITATYIYHAISFMLCKMARILAIRFNSILLVLVVIEAIYTTKLSCVLDELWLRVGFFLQVILTCVI